MRSGLAGRPRFGGLPVPFACDDDGVPDHGSIVRKRAIECALSRVCGICGTPLTRPICFIGPDAEAAAGLFTFPPTHLTCAREAFDLFAPIGGRHLGQTDPPLVWALVTTGGFDLIRPTRRGEPVAFHPNSVLQTTLLD